jgi:hypothetical protein
MKETEMKPNKGNLLAALQVLYVIKNIAVGFRPIDGADAATTMSADIISMILTCWVSVGGFLKGNGYLKESHDLLSFVVPGTRPTPPSRDTVEVLLSESQDLYNTCANLAGTMSSPGRHSLDDDFAKCESAVQEVINRFLRNLRDNDRPAFNKFVGDLVHY